MQWDMWDEEVGRGTGSERCRSIETARKDRQRDQRLKGKERRRTGGRKRDRDRPTDWEGRRLDARRDSENK